jgi:hypothetical protein
MPLALPYGRLNLRYNPFGELEPEERAALAVVDLAALLERLRRPPFVAQFLGEAGRGKTTHLLALRGHFPEAVYVHVGEGERPVLPEAGVLFVDETQRLTPRARLRLFRRARVLALGTHEDHSAELSRAGVPFQTLEVGGVDLGRLERIVQARLQAARRGPGPLPQVPRRSLEALVARFGDDVRAIEHELYERIQSLDHIAEIEVSFPEAQ